MRKEIILLTLGLFVLFSFVQLHFFNYYTVFGIPFGKVDVDIYMQTIADGEFSPDHLLLTAVPSLLYSVVDPAFLYTVSIPFFVCIVLPLTLFMFSYYFSKDKLTAFISVGIMLFGTFTLQVYLISALWAQMLATVFALWSIIFVDLYEKEGRGVILGIALLFGLFTILSHPAGFAMVFMYVAMKVYTRVSKKFMFVIILLIMLSMGVFVLNEMTNMFGSYIYSVTIGYVLMYFAMPFVWILAVVGMFGLIHGDQRYLVFMTLITFAVSPAFILWRPLISILPLISYFAAVALVWFTRLYDDFGFRNFIIPVFFILFAAFVVFYVSDTTNTFMNAMLWEMEADPGYIDVLPRSVNSTIVRDMYFGGQHVCHVIKDAYGNRVSERCY